MAIYRFSKYQTTAVDADPVLLGGKGAGLVKMSKMGLNVPPGIIIPTTMAFAPVNADLVQLVGGRVRGFVAQELGYENGHYPLVSVRSGARVSMPGMMDTLLNVGITSTNLAYWKDKMGERAALDSYRRLLQMFGVTVFKIDTKHFHEAMQSVMQFKYGQSELPTKETSLSVAHLEKLIVKYRTIIAKYGSAAGMPDTLELQLEAAIKAVFNSWNSDRAKAYRKLNNIPENWGTAVVIQAMVFGNLNDQSASGVLFSRDPSTGVKVVLGEFLPNAQGEDVVSGSATPLKLQDMDSWNQDAFDSLMTTTNMLENEFKDMVDVEFTVESGKVYILQVRSGKRSASAAFKIAYDLVAEGRITKEEALKRVTPEQYLTLSRSVIDPKHGDKGLLGVGIKASKGVATGKVWLSSKKAQSNPGGILVSQETTPDDFEGMAVSAGILTQKGGATSHAAVVARSMDKACVVGCTDIEFVGSSFKLGNTVVTEGDNITIDGSTGKVYEGEVPMVGGKVTIEALHMLNWVDIKDKFISVDVTTDPIPSQGEVCLSLHNLNDQKSVEGFVQQINSHPDIHGVVTLREQSAFDDTQFLKTLAIDTDPNCGTGEQIAGLTGLNPNWTVVGVPDHVHVDSFKAHRKLKTLSQLMTFEGYCEAAPELIETLKSQGVTVEQFIELLKKSGKSVKPLTKAITRQALAFSVFGK